MSRRNTDISLFRLLAKNPRSCQKIQGETMKTLTAIILTAIIAFAIGHHSGRADAESELFAAGYSDGYEEAVREPWSVVCE